MNIAYLLDNVIVAIAPESLDPQVEGIVFDDTYPDAAGLQVGDRQVSPGQFERAVPVASVARELAPIDFQRRFAPAKYLAAKVLAESNTDATMTYIWGLFDKAEIVHLDNADTISGIAYMEHVAGILTAEEAAAVLA